MQTPPLSPPAAAAATTLAEDLADHLPQTRRAAENIAHALTRGGSSPPPTLDHLVRDLATSLAEDIPDVPWTREDGTGVLDGEWARDPATLQALLPKIALATAPEATAADRANAFRALSDQELTALGVPPQDIPTLRESLDGTDFNAIRAGMTALRKLTPHSPDARNAASDLAETAASNRATVPTGDTTIQRLPNGRYLVHDPTTGEEIGQARNRNAAVRMAQRAAEHSNPPADSGDGDSASNSDSDPADTSPDGDTISPSPDPDMDTTGNAITDPADGSDPGATSLLKITDSAAATTDPAVLTDPAAVAAADPASASAAPADPSAAPDPPPPAIDPATIDPDPPAAPKTYNGETVDAAWYQRKARSATNHPASPVIVLGKWDQDGVSYVIVAKHFDIDGEPKATYFQLTDWDALADKLNEKELWHINETFLDQQLLEGKRIYFSHDSRKANGYFKAEVKFLKDKLGITDDNFIQVVKSLHHSRMNRINYNITQEASDRADRRMAERFRGYHKPSANQWRP